MRDVFSQIEPGWQICTQTIKITFISIEFNDQKQNHENFNDKLCHACITLLQKW